jgi:DNA-binding transcriptional regulator YdaS (Cro superfamily)
MSKPTQIAGIRYAVAVAGSQKKLAALLGVTLASVNRWVKKGYVPDERIEQIHKLYGIQRSRLCNPAYLEFAADKDNDQSNINQNEDSKS